MGVSIKNATTFEGAFAVGVFINRISNIDYLNGRFDAAMRLYVFNITEPICEYNDALRNLLVFSANSSNRI